MRGSAAPPRGTEGRGRPGFLICGTGMRLGHMTLETHDALRGCGQIFCVNLPEEVLGQVRGAFPQAEDLTAPFRRGVRFTESALCARLESLWDQRRDAAVLFLGHPLLYTAASRLVGRCRRRRRPYRILACLSSVDAALVAAEPDLEDQYLDLYGAGLAVHSAQELLGGGVPLDCRFPTLLMNLFRLRDQADAGGSAWTRLARYLERFYPARHPVILVRCGRDGPRDHHELTSIGGLGRLRRAPDSEVTLLLPMRRP